MEQQSVSETNYDNIIFLIDLLNPEDREELAKKYSKYLDQIVSRTAKMKLLRGDIHLNDEKILKLIELDDSVLNFVVNKVRQKIDKAQSILSVISKNGDYNV